MLNTTAASTQSARQLAAAVENTGGTAPQVLTDIISGFDLLADQPAQRDPARRIVDAAAAGELTAERLDRLCAEAAQGQAVADYRGQLRQRLEGLFVERFHKRCATAPPTRSSTRCAASLTRRQQHSLRR